MNNERLIIAPATTLGIILVGGEARRMDHRPKHLIRRADGRTMMQAVHDALAPLCAEIVLVGHAIDDDPNVLPHCPRLGDRDAERHGPLAGSDIGLEYAASSDTPFNAAIIAPCDTPEIRTEALAALLDQLIASRASAFHLEPEGRMRPLPHAIRVDEHAEVRAHLDRGQRRVRTLLEDLGVQTVSTDDAQMLLNINAPEDLADQSTA